MTEQAKQFVEVVCERLMDNYNQMKLEGFVRDIQARLALECDMYLSEEIVRNTLNSMVKKRIIEVYQPSGQKFVALTESALNKMKERV